SDRPRALSAGAVVSALLGAETQACNSPAGASSATAVSVVVPRSMPRTTGMGGGSLLVEAGVLRRAGADALGDPGELAPRRGVLDRLDGDLVPPVVAEVEPVVK